MSLRGPWYFAEVNFGEVFGAEHYREDQKIFAAKLGQTEANYATLTITIRNPRTTLIGPHHPVYCFFAYDDQTDVTLVFTGRLVGLPTNLFAEIIELKYIAQPLDWPAQKQIAATPLKVNPGYDALFLDPAKRDDPDSILEGYARVFHTDRTTLAITTTDIIAPEDGTIVFTGDDAFYDSVSFTIAEPPLQLVNVESTVAWTQSWTGIVDIGQRTFFSYTGNGFISEWPKPEAQLGGGYSVYTSLAFDTWGISLTIPASNRASWKSTQKEHEVGDTIAYDNSSSGAGFRGPFLRLITASSGTIGEINPYDPDFVDKPTSTSNSSWIDMPQWRVDTSLVLRCDPIRQRSERVRFTMQANLQQVITPAQSPPLPSSETISVPAQDVSQQLFNVLDWQSVKGQAVSFAQVIYPNLPTVLGGMSYQICLTPGTAGTDEPQFSDIVGEQTIDGTVVWVSMGDTLNAATPDWASSTFYPAGSIIRPLAPISAPWSVIVPAPRVNGTAVNLGQIIVGNNGVFQMVTLPGTTGIREPAWAGGYGGTTADGTAVWTSIGPTMPNGTIYFMAIAAGISADTLPPNWNFTTGATFTDGTVTWQCFGTAGGFIDIPIGDLSRSQFWETTRGQLALQHLILRGRARLLLKSRCAKTTFKCKFENILAISLRMGALLQDTRIPGGQAEGKITQYELNIDGSQGSQLGTITFMSTVGFEEAAIVQPGNPTYVTGYVDGYRIATEAVTLLPAGDVGYTPPSAAIVDDGLTFPLTRAQIVRREQDFGSLDEQVQAFINAGQTLQGELLLNVQSTLDQQTNLWLVAHASVQAVVNRHPIWHDLDLKPASAGPFHADVPVLTTQLGVPMQVFLGGVDETPLGTPGGQPTPPSPPTAPTIIQVSEA